MKWSGPLRVLTGDERYGNLADADVPKLKRLRAIIAVETEKVIWEKEFSKLTGEPDQTGIEIEASPSQIKLNLPSYLSMRVPRESLSPHINSLIQPEPSQ